MLAQTVTTARTQLSRILAAGAHPAPNPEVTILYEDFSTGLSAKTLFDRLLNVNTTEPGYRLSMWKFNLLRVRPLQNQAAQDASASGIICVAARAEGDLPSEVGHLVTEALRFRHGAPTALVVLVETTQLDAAEGLPSIKSLGKLAGQTGAAFFVHCIEPGVDKYELACRQR